MLHVWVRVSLLVLLSAAPAWAARSVTLSPTQPIAVRLELNQLTMLVLPEPVDSVMVVYEPAYFMTDWKGAYLAVAPIRPEVTDGQFFVVGASGTMYHVVYTLRAPADTLIHILAAAPPAVKAVPFSLHSWFRYLRQGQPIPGSQALDLPWPASPDPRVAVVQSAAVALGSKVGVTVVLRNTQTTPLVLDVRVGLAGDPGLPGTLHLGDWSWPAHYTLEAIAADPEVLAPESDGRIYVVLERKP
jgi:hypothetical protein